MRRFVAGVFWILLCLPACGFSTERIIVLLGDSITEQAFAGSGYAVQLKSAFPNWQFVNSGRSGEKTDDLLLRLDSDVLAWSPSLVVLMIGINDVWHRMNTGFAEGDLLAFQDNLMKIVERLSGQVPVLLCTTTVIGESPESPGNRLLKDVNDAIHRMGVISNVTIVDVNQVFLAACANPGHERLTRDGVHLTDEGNALVAGELNKALRSTISSAQSAVAAREGEQKTSDWVQGLPVQG